MSPKGSKKQVKATETMKEDDENPNAFLFSDTSQKIGVSCKEWNKMYEYLEKGYFSSEYPEDSDNFVDIRRSTLHKIVARLVLTPYSDMVHWVIFHVDLNTCTIENEAKQVIGYFRLEDLEVMYKLPKPKIKLDGHFLMHL
jgi:hypothetical protein